MYNLNTKNWKIAGIAIFSSVSLVISSCKKEITETNELKNSNLNSNYSTNIIENQLSNFWTNYAAFKNATIDGNETPDLDGIMNESEMLSTLHYSLNVALTEVDTTYEEVTNAEFLNEITLTGENTFTNQDVCIFFDKTLQSIKAYTSSTELIERKIHEITLEIESYSDNIVIINTKVKFSSGDLYAASDIEWTATKSPYLVRFTPNYQIPWVAKSTAEQDKQGAGQGKYNYFNYVLNNNWNITSSGIGTIQTKLTADKAAHDVLSNNALCWIDPSILPSTIAIPTNSKIVPSEKLINGKDTKVELINKESSMDNPSENITPLDVAVNCGNPSSPNLSQGSEGENDIQPSALLSYYNSEHFYGLTEFRQVNGKQMDFLWKNRDRIIKVAFSKKASELNTNLTSFTFGFYAVNELKYVAQAWQSIGEINACHFIQCSQQGNMWTICHYQCDYRPDIIFKHYSYQPLAPAQFRNLQNSVL